MKRGVLFFSFLILTFCSHVYAQTAFLDSLYQAYESEPEEIRYTTLVRYCFGLMNVDSSKTNQLVAEAIDNLPSSSLSIEKQYFYKGQFYEIKAIMAGNVGDIKTRLAYYQNCLEMAQLIPGKDGQLLRGIAHWGFGTAYGQQGLFEKSNIELYLAQKAFGLAGQPKKQADCYAQVSQNFNQLEQYDSVLVYINKALEFKGVEEDFMGRIYYTFFKANVFNRLGMQDSTIILLNPAYLERVNKARPQLYAHLIMAKSDAFSEKKLFEQAEVLLKNARKLIDEFNDSQLEYNYLVSNMNFEKSRNNYEAAYVALEKLYAFQDSIDKRATEDRYMELQSKYDAQSKDFQISALEQKTDYQKNILLVGGTLFSLALLFTILWYRNREQKRLAIQSKNNQQIRISFKYDEPEIEDGFLKKITQLINDHMIEEDFSVEKLAQLAGLNRSNLNKQLKVLTSKTSGKFIREVRLEKARALLLKNDKNISEVAFQVGFKDPNYFSTSFKDYFGFPPSELRKTS